LRNEGTVHLVLGMAHFNQGDYNQALNELAEAEKHNSSKGMAQQWLRFVQSEKDTQERLQAGLSS
jgi:Tfp pilus assembly protein PilF